MPKRLFFYFFFKYFSIRYVKNVSQNLGQKFTKHVHVLAYIDENFKWIFLETRFSNTVPTITQKLFDRFTPNFSWLYHTLLRSFLKQRISDLIHSSFFIPQKSKFSCPIIEHLNQSSAISLKMNFFLKPALSKTAFVNIL